MALNKFIKSKVYGYLRSNMQMYDYRNGWMKGDCPECGEHKLGVNVGQDRTNCFKCGYNDKPLFLIGKREGITKYHDIVSFIQGFKFEGRVYEIKQEITNYELSPGSLPLEYKSVLRTDTKMGKRIKNYLINRGFDITTLASKGWGYCEEGDYTGYIIIPYYIDNKLIYFTARRLSPAYGPKFNNPKIEDFGIGKSMLIYNHDALLIEDKVYLVESATNAETIGEQAFAAGGKSLSKYQINQILKSQCEKIIIILDPDAYHEALELAIKLVDYKKVKVVKLPDGYDINDIGREKTLYYVHKSKYMNKNQLIRLKNG